MLKFFHRIRRKRLDAGRLRKCPRDFFQIMLCIFFLYFSISSLSGQRTISGKVFEADGKEQVGGYVSTAPSWPENTVVYGIELGSGYTIEVPDTSRFLFFYWEGFTMNPTVPIDNKDTINVFNAVSQSDARISYPKVKEDRSLAVKVYGMVSSAEKARYNEVTIIPMTSKDSALPEVKPNEQGKFYLEVPPQAKVLKVEYKWLTQYFVIPDVRSIYLPVSVSDNLLSKKLNKRVKRQWQRKNKKIKNQ